MPFDYYRRLSRRDQEIYRKSDALHAVRLPNPSELQPLAGALEEALSDDDRARVEAAAGELVGGITAQLGVAEVVVEVLAVRPRLTDSELHGLYTQEEDGPAHIRVWMRTVHHKRVVAFRTFLRTLLHEVCHHLDFTLFQLPESFHTEGFFKRESSLVHQLVRHKVE